MKKLPQVEKIVTETIDGKKVQKQIYADGSYGIRNRDTVERFFSDGKRQVYDLNDEHIFTLRHEVLPDGTEHEWYENGQMYKEKLPDDTCTQYDEEGNITYHKTKGVEDTVAYLAKQRVAKKKKENLDKLKGAPEFIQKAASEVASSKLFGKVALAVAKAKVKIGKGE